MSCLPLDHEALALLRRLRPSEALQVLQQAWNDGPTFCRCGLWSNRMRICMPRPKQLMSCLLCFLAQRHNVVACKGWTNSTCKHSYLHCGLWDFGQDLLWKVGLPKCRHFLDFLPLVQVSIQGINNNMSSYIKIKAQSGSGTASMEPDVALHFALGWKVRSKLGDPDNTDEAARFEGMLVREMLCRSGMLRLRGSQNAAASATKDGRSEAGRSEAGRETGEQKSGADQAACGGRCSDGGRNFALQEIEWTWHDKCVCGKVPWSISWQDLQVH